MLFTKASSGPCSARSRRHADTHRDATNTIVFCFPFQLVLLPTRSQKHEVICLFEASLVQDPAINPPFLNESSSIHLGSMVSSPSIRLSRPSMALSLLFCLASLCHCSAFAFLRVTLPTVDATTPWKPIASKLGAFARRQTSDSQLPSSQLIKQEWIDRSLVYYRKVMREERRLQGGQLKDIDSKEYQDEFTQLANKHYFALRKIKDGKPLHAERIYRRIIDELYKDDDECDHAKLAVTTLLLALLLQRMRAPAKETRSVFLHFFRVAILDSLEGECACSAKVLGAFALFEMKHGNTTKSYHILQLAVKLDPSLAPMLQWKQFRDVSQRMSSSTSTHVSQGNNAAAVA
jgi:hypothetical protein